MNPKHSLEWIKKFESKYDALNYNISGIDCWPIVRNTLLSMELPKSSQRAGMGHAISSISIIDVTKSFLAFFSFKKSNVFILSDTKFSESIAGSMYLKDAHALNESARLNGESTVIALQNLSVDKTVVGREHCRSVFAILLLAASVAKFSSLLKCFPKFSSYMERLLNELAAAPMLVNSSVSGEALKKQIYKNILFCLIASKLFSLILRRIEPDKAYVICYYSVLGMALCAACRKLGVPVTDIQHGVAGANMRAYAGWFSIPEQGYTTLPDTFFCWTPFDAEAISQWAQSSTRHRAIVTGSLWRNYVLDKLLLVEAQRQWCSFFDQIDVYEKKVLITMQSSTLSPLFVDAIERCQANYCFLIRMHPGFMLDKDASFLNLIKSHRNVYFEQPSSMPIQLLMMHVDAHVTEWSGAVVDAYFEGVRSIVVSEEALDYFDEYIKSGNVVYAASLSELLAEVDRL